MRSNDSRASVSSTPDICWSDSCVGSELVISAFAYPVEIARLPNRPSPKLIATGIVVSVTLLNNRPVSNV